MENRSKSGEVDLYQFTDFHNTLTRVHKIACEGGIPTVSFQSAKVRKTVFLRNPCWEDISCILIKRRNRILVTEDSIGKSFGQMFPLDQMHHFIRKDIQNQGHEDNLSESPDRLVFHVSVDHYDPKQVISILDELTQIYEEITGDRNMHIWFYPSLRDLPPPPPPPR